MKLITARDIFEKTFNLPAGINFNFKHRITAGIEFQVFEPR